MRCQVSKETLIIIGAAVVLILVAVLYIKLNSKHLYSNMYYIYQQYSQVR
ncbi:MAG: hypothetical protein GXO42_00075 [bacterium]|nr:hypothetical protein [bacterium]